MTTDQVLAVLRRLLEEVDLVASTSTDEELLQVISDARDIFELNGEVGFESLAVGTDQTEAATYGILPDPSLQLGHLLALSAAIRLLESTYRSRLSRGELGVSWSSGLETESTISQARSYREAIADMENRLERLILVKRKSTTGTRVQ